MIQAIWTEQYRISSFLVNFQNELPLHDLLALLQETAWRHASHLGHGYAETHERGAAWVLIRQRVEMERWPGWGEDLTIRTWLRPPGAAVVTRDFQMLVGDRQIGQGAAHWITISERHRRPIALGFPDRPELFRQQGHLAIDPVKIAPRDGMRSLAEFEVRNSDLDMNTHVNNTRFAQWILDAIPLRDHQSHRLRAYQVNFLAEARPGDKIAVMRPSLAELGVGEAIPFQGQRLSDGKVLFTALLGAAPREER